MPLPRSEWAIALYDLTALGACGKAAGRQADGHRQSMIAAPVTTPSEYVGTVVERLPG
jgi:hypothetical protein